MSDSLSKAIHYRELAAECVKLAELGATDRIRAHYQTIAECYLERARAELRNAEKNARQKSSISTAIS